ncbi:TonB-dependent siderophore receptor [Sphingomonas sp. NPDC092331]|uniref:TonB-dependent siderophore receptor n=2 Tax=Bacteria TaxID=2 RepID=UPI0031F5C319
MTLALTTRVLACTGALVLVPSLAVAQEAAPAANAFELALDDDITVTGRRDGFKADVTQIGAFRNQRLLDTPLTIAVVNRALLDAQGAVGLEDAIRNTAGITQQGVSQLTTNSFVSRGVIINARSNYRLNGTLPIFSYLPAPLENKERVEVLKGVSALYYGFTPPSAIVNLVTKRAGAKPVTSVLATSDAEGSYGGGIDIGRTFGPNGIFGVRVNAFAGHLETPMDGINGNRWFVSGAFDVRPADNLSVQIDVEHYQRRMGEPGALSLPAAVGAVGGNGGVITLPQLPDPRRSYAPDGAFYKGTATNILGRIDYAIGGTWSIRADLGYARTARDRFLANLGGINLATGIGRVAGNFNRGEGYDNTNLRLEANGKVTTGIIVHDLLFGFTKNRQAEDDRTASPFSYALNIADPLPPAVSALVYGTPRVTPAAANYGTGIYALDLARIGSQWLVIAGLRAESVRVRRTSGSYRTKTVTPTAGLVFHPSERTSLYGTYIEGLESAGTAPDGTTNAGELLPPLVSRQYELGARAEVGGALASIAYFNIDRALTYTNAARTFVADGRARHRGVEASLQGRLGSTISVSLSGQYLDAVQRRTASTFQNGKPIVNAPRWAGSAFVEYRPAFLEDAFGVNAGIYYTGKRSADVQERVSLPAYALVSLGMNYRVALPGGASMVLRANADNVFNKRYWPTAGDGVLYRGVPRTIRFQAMTSF